MRKVQGERDGSSSACITSVTKFVAVEFERSFNPSISLSDKVGLKSFVSIADSFSGVESSEGLIGVVDMVNEVRKTKNLLATYCPLKIRTCPTHLHSDHSLFVALVAQQSDVKISTSSSSQALHYLRSGSSFLRMMQVDYTGPTRDIDPIVHWW